MAVAVLIVNYRSYRALEICLASLTRWLSPDDEVAVVDWESDSGLLEPLREKFASVQWLSRPDNSGFAAGVNMAAALTAAPTLLLLNPDSVVDGPVGRILEKWLSTHPQCAAAGPQILDKHGKLQASARRFPDVTTMLGGRTSWLTSRFPGNWFTRRNLLMAVEGEYAVVDWLSGACLATPRSVFMKLGGLDEGFFLYWEDADYGRRASDHGYESHYVPAAGVVRHVTGVSSSQAPVLSIRAFHRSAARLFWKHAGAGRVLAPLVSLGLWLRGEVQIGVSRLSRAFRKPNQRPD
jgi:GT2 family glycosyltransferase